MPVNTTIKIRKGTESEWASSNPVLASGEPGFVTNTNRFKIGDGITSWNSLNYAAVVPSGFLAGSGINISLGTQGVSATIGVSGLNTSYLSDFSSSVSGLIPVKNIVAGTGISVSSSSGIYTIISTGSGVLAEQSSSLVTTVFNKTASTIPKMSAVYINGGQGDTPTIELAIATGDPTSAGTYGLTRESIASMSLGKVTVFGALTGLDTDQFNPTAPVGNVNGSVLYLSPSVSGGLTTTKPSAPNHIVAIGTIVRTHQNEGVIEVRVQNGFELDELHNVAISGVTNGQFLQYNSASQLWVPSSSGNFSTLQLNGTTVSVVGHTHTSSDITNFNSSVSGLLPTIANSGDNRVLTSTGSTVGANAESNLTFDGNLLNVTGSGSFSSNLRLNGQTANTIAGFDASKNITSLNTSTYPNLTELSYVKDVTSAIQTQLNNKAALVHTHVVNDITNFASGVADEVSTTITAGTGINLDYDSGTDTLTINVSGLINNPADNRILTSRDSSGSLIDAESNLTFTDGVLTLGGLNNSTVSQIHVYNNNAGDNTTSLRLFNANADIMISIDSNDDTDNNEILSFEYPLWIYSLGGPLNLFTYTTLDINAASGTSVSNGNFKIDNQTANTIAGFDSNKNVTSLATSTYPNLTELSYVKGVTSALQTQINSKQNTLTNPVTGTGIASHVAYWNSSSGIVADSGQLYWDASNNRLGIGTNNPQELIHISGATTAFAGIRFDNSSGQGGTITAANNMLYVNSAFRVSSSKIRLGDGASAGTIELTSGGSISQDGNGGGLTFSGTTGRFSNGLEITGALAVNNSGVPVGSGTSNYVSRWTGSSILGTGLIFDNGSNVGIGTASPSGRLHVIGSGIFTSGVRVGDSSSNAFVIGPSGNANIRFNNGGFNWIELSSNTFSGSSTYISTQLIFLNGNATYCNGTFQFPKAGNTPTSTATQRDSNSILFYNRLWDGAAEAAPANEIISKASTTTNIGSRLSFFMQNGDGTQNRTERFSVLSNGNIGIGTIAPATRLDVSGSGNFTGTVTASGNITGQNLISSFASGDEGGEILLTKPPNGTLNGTGITIDAYQNRLRFFEQGGSTRGFYVDFSEGVAGASRPLINKSLVYFTPLDNQPPASNFATLDTRNSIAVLDFDDTTEESAVFVGVLPENAALGSGISVRIYWMATSATTGSCRWGVQFEKMNTDLDSDSFDTATEAHSTTNGTAGIVTTTSITCTSIDSLAAGDLFRIKIYRDVSDTTNDTMTGDAEIVAVELRSVL